MDNINNLNSRLRALILKERENYAVEVLHIIEYHLMKELPEEDVKTYIKNARKIVFKND
tara:strand:+ start:142 stop:318 length:177 start_codon:yes stop_codon:yes gene_type:complete